MSAQPVTILEESAQRATERVEQLRGELVRARADQLAIVRLLRAQGATYQRIGELCGGISRSAVCQALR